MSERAIRLFVPGFLLVYFLVGFGRWITYQTEIYPFGAWGMFQRVSKISIDYDLVIHRMGERRFVPPARAREPDDPSGIELSGQTRLVLNGFYRYTQRGEPEEAARYREFIDRHVVGPDAEYEIARLHLRSRRDEQHEAREQREGPFRTDPRAAPPDPDARFAFPDSGDLFRVEPEPEERRSKRKRSSS